jgi:hypothetical protein
MVDLVSKFASQATTFHLLFHRSSVASLAGGVAAVLVATYLASGREASLTNFTSIDAPQEFQNARKCICKRSSIPSKS